MSDNTETILTFTVGDDEYEIDHLGIGYDSNWGMFAVYQGDRQIADFAIPQSALKPEFRPKEMPVSDQEIVFMAIDALRKVDRV